jgi:ABC-type branched-subunit amino acid transport system ATPase component
VTSARPAAAPALETRGLRKAFGGHVVLDGVDLTFETGRLSALIGRASSPPTAARSA